MKVKLKTLLILLLIFIPLYSFNSEKWYTLYFTKPGYSSSNCPRKGFIETIKKAKTSISGAFYDLSDWVIAKELINAKKRGVNINLVSESDNIHRKAIRNLIKAGITVKGDNKKGLMHHKFAIIDKKILWTGSYNLTYNGYKKNNNNAIKIISPELSALYLKEFNEMFYNNTFQNRYEREPLSYFKRYHVNIRRTKIHVYFSPEDNIEKVMLKKIQKAKKSIYFMAFSFTSNKIGEAMIKKYKNGTTVKGIFESHGTKQRYSEYIKMKLEGLQVRVDKNRYLMHHKVIIIDDKTVILGSYNFSKNANKKNDENILIIKNKNIAVKYLREFNSL